MASTSLILPFSTVCHLLFSVTILLSCESVLVSFLMIIIKITGNGRFPLTYDVDHGILNTYW